MLILYSITGCDSNKKLKEYLRNQKIEFIEKNLYKVLLEDKELEILLKNPLQEIINERFLDSVKDLNKEELKETICHNPIICKRPIVIGEEKEIIESIIKKNCDKSCGSYLVCGELFK